LRGGGSPTGRLQNTAAFLLESKLEHQFLTEISGTGEDRPLLDGHPRQQLLRSVDFIPQVISKRAQLINQFRNGNIGHRAHLKRCRTGLEFPLQITEVAFILIYSRQRIMRQEAILAGQDGIVGGSIL